jgi:hypothetical protein
MYNVLVVLVLSLGVSADIIIATSLCYCLRTMRMSGVGECVDLFIRSNGLP